MPTQVGGAKIPEDAKLRPALDNLRYKLCTQDDIKLFAIPCCRQESRQTQAQPAKIQKYKLLADNDEGGTKKQREKTVNPRRLTNILSEELQNCLSPTLTNHLPGKPPLCIDMPIMIKLEGLSGYAVLISHQSRKVQWKMLDGDLLTISRVCIHKLTGGIAGSLRQEFRELELLDEITKLLQLGKISSKWKGEQFMPKTIHQAFENNRDPFPIAEVEEDCVWQLIQQPKKTKKKGAVPDNLIQAVIAEKTKAVGYVAAKGTQTLRGIS
ncbi:hypothetical protein BV20DRAFT_982117 [Pilatotrama ljubarskyi]|nr:hypothetical protein BV20DRAFT_982117 [Pilatotrama ljubarskyi]